MSGELLYLYCVTGEIPHNAISGSNGEEVYFISNNDICAAVSTVKEDDFTDEGLRKNLTDIQWVESKVRSHEKVVENIMEHTAVIPFKFATIFRTRESLRAMLDNHMDNFTELLRKLHDKEEWDIKIYCDMKSVQDFVARDNGEIRRIEEEIGSSPAGKSFFLEKKKEKLLGESADRIIAECCRKSFDILKGQSTEARLNRLLPKELTERNDEMILNATFLVARDNVGGFADSINHLKGKYKESGLRLNCTGPWPPYNFCPIPGGIAACLTPS